MNFSSLNVSSIIDKTLEASVVGSFSSIGYSLRKRLFKWSEPLENLTGKTIVLTGATGGIGTAAANQLALAGANLILIGRSAEKLKNLTSGLVTSDTQKIDFIQSDFLNLTDVKNTADQLNSKLDSVHAIIHNAGAIFKEFALTDDGIERTATLHVLAPFLLTTMLSNLFNNDSRIIFTTSGGMYTQNLDIEKLDRTNGNNYNGTRAYAVAKRAQVALAEQMSLRMANGNFFSYHPGWVNTPGLKASLPGFSKLIEPILRTPQQGADTMLWLCGNQSVSRFSTSLMHDRDARKKTKWPKTNPYATSNPSDLWDWCESKCFNQGKWV